MRVEVFIPSQSFEINDVPDDSDVAVGLMEAHASEKVRGAMVWWVVGTCGMCAEETRLCRESGDGRCLYCCDCDS